MENYKQLQAHDANGDLSKICYISYYFRNPKTNKFERFRETGDINHIKNLKQRREALFIYKQAKQVILEKGWSPHKQMNVESFYNQVDLLFHSIKDAIEIVLPHKKLHQKHTTHSASLVQNVL